MTGGESKPDATTSEVDELLARILSEVSDRLIRGESVSLEQTVAAHPSLAEPIRELWGAVMLADAVSSQVHHQQSSGVALNPDQNSEAIAALPLPCQFGDFELLEEVGRGGMGVVYRARQLSLGRTVAVKMLVRGQMASQEDETRFRQEAEAAARLTHPNIVPVYEVGTSNDRIYFTMKYIEGHTLTDRLAQGPLPPQETAKLLACTSRAVAYAHSQGVLHRDLKPSNILIDFAGEPHVSDFGLARQVSEASSLTRSGAVLGTPAYMSPEQAAGNRGDVGPTSDVYSLGAVLYQCLTGRPPFQADTPVHVVLLVLEQDPPPPRVLVPSVDRDLEMIALRCLQKPSDLRYPSASALARDLEAYLNDEPVSARSGRFSHVVASWFRETHNATVLENWGLLWMWHSLALLVTCLLTNAMSWMGDTNRIHYFLVWTAGLGTWAAVFWALRRRMGPVTFVERQIAHVWAASMISIGLLFPIEYLLDLPVLKLSPIVALTSGMVFLVKAGILSGTFYVQAVTLFGSAALMATWPEWAHIVFGVVAAGCFFVPGWKYHRQRMQNLKARK